MIKEVKKILREEMLTIGTSVETAKTGQMWEYDVERLSKRICQLRPKVKLPPCPYQDKHVAEGYCPGCHYLAWHECCLKVEEVLREAGIEVE